MSKVKTIQQVLEKWEYCTLKADGSYHRCEFEQASKVFSLSADMLEPWMDSKHPKFWQIVHFFVLSCHNSAQAFQRNGRIKEAEYYYRYAHSRLLGFFNQRQQESAVFYERLVIELYKTFDLLEKHLTTRNKQRLAYDIHQESIRVINQGGQRVTSMKCL